MDYEDKNNEQLNDSLEEIDVLKYEIEVLKRQVDTANMNSLNMRKQSAIMEQQIKNLGEKNAELKELQKEKNEMFATIVHDIKNPTMVIKSLVELLKGYSNNSDEQRSIINDLIVTTKQVISLSVEISKVLTMDEVALELFYEEADPEKLVNEVVRRNSINAKNKKQSIVVDIEPNLPMFCVDVVKICEVFENLISNSIKYTQPEGKIGVKAYKSGKYIQLDFSDNGLGMSEEDLKNAFKRGQKLSAKPTGGETSSGLGLWIIKRIIEAHGGVVRIKSSLGVGSTFTVGVPIQREPTTAPEA